LAREKHKFPSSTVIGIRNSHRGPVRITEEFDYGRGFLVGNTIDHQPFLWERCAFHWNVESATDSTFASIAGQQVGALNLLECPFWCANRTTTPSSLCSNVSTVC